MPTHGTCEGMGPWTNPVLSVDFETRGIAAPPTGQHAVPRRQHIVLEGGAREDGDGRIQPQHLWSGTDAVRLHADPPAGVLTEPGLDSNLTVDLLEYEDTRSHRSAFPRVNLSLFKGQAAAFLRRLRASGMTRQLFAVSNPLGRSYGSVFDNHIDCALIHAAGQRQ